MRTKSKSQVSRRRAVAAAVSAACLAAAASPTMAQQRSLGLDISAWQGNISQTTWNNFRNVENREFVFIRSSRGGTTGYYNQSDPDNNLNQNTLSQRYDDPYFIQNINRATTAGMYAGSYHFSRPDIIESTKNSGGIRNTGTDEANHFIQMAGAFMRPGYLVPVHDLEAGISQRSATELAQFSLDFSNRIYEVMGIRPAVYINGQYNQALQSATLSQRNQLAQPAVHSPSVVSPAYPTLWIARWPNQDDPNSIPVHTAHPKDTVSYIYGPWDDYGTTHPWQFWQYTSRGRLQSFNNGGSNLDMNVAHGDAEFLKDNLVPAVWMNDSSGSWNTLANWNSGQQPIVPVQGPGQVARVGPLTLPTPRLPGAAGTGVTAGHNDTVILERPNANITVTLDSGTFNIRKLFVREKLNIGGTGSLNVNYLPPQSIPANYAPWIGLLTAQFSDTVTLSGSGALSLHTLQVDSARTFNLNGGTFTFNTTNLMRAANPAKILIGGNVTLAPLNDATATINSVGASGTQATIDLTGGTRTITVNDGSSAIDLNLNLAIVNGTLIKDGPGTMRLGVANTLTGNVTINRGILLVTGPNQLGNTGVITNQTVVTPGSNGYGGSLQLSGNVNYNLPLSLGGGGETGTNLTTPGKVGALDSLSGTNTWAGTITLRGGGANGNDPLLNQIGARAGTLVLSGAIQNATGVNASLLKSGDGDVVLTGAAANTYTGLTRLYGGRLIIEKNAALGAAGSTDAAAGNTFQLAGSASTLAFRAPAGTSGFNYSTFEVINTDGTGAPGFAQVDNFGGNNVFAGALAIGGPSVAGSVTGSIGVTAGSLEVQGGLYARGTTAVRTINKQGPGTLILSGAGSGAPTGNANVTPLANSTLNVNAGKVELRGATHATNLLPGVTTWNVNSGATLQNVSGTLAGATVNVNSGGSFLYSGGRTDLAALNLVGGDGQLTAGRDKVLRTGSLSIAPGRKLNLADNSLIVDYAGGSVIGSWNGSAYTGITGLVQSGRNEGEWTGSGIVSTVSAAEGGGDYTTLGVAEASDALGISGAETALWNGQTVDATSVLVSYTYGGDANLDGVVNIDDYGQIDFNIGLSGSVFGWFNGDFNYDGLINIDDYGIIDFNIGVQGAPMVIIEPPEAPLAGMGAVSAVPEPAGAATIICLGAALTARRRRRQRIA